MKKKIRDLPVNAVYRRQDGRIYVRIDGKVHASCREGQPGEWILTGQIEPIDFEEEVEVMFEK